MFEHHPRKLVYAANLNKRIEEMYLHFLTAGKEIKIRKEEDEVRKNV